MAEAKCYTYLTTNVMVHVLITVKPSSRFPGKNARLVGYTVAWLAMELLHMVEPARVYTVGSRTELPAVMPLGWEHIECKTGSHRGDIDHAEAQVAPAPGDVMILAQVTQPLRRMGLLADVAMLARRKGCAVTACDARQEDWRTLTAAGTWNACKGRRTMLHDGALYGWQPGKVGMVFDAAAPHAVAINYPGQPVDVDVPADIPHALPAAFSELLLQDYGLQSY